MRDNAIFISYRRDDTGPFALALRSELDLRLSGAPVFVDLNRIQGGDVWPEVLSDALAKSRLVVALIGAGWAGDDGVGASRIKNPDDWVTREVAEGLRRGIVLPVLVNGAPPPQDLPAVLQGLSAIQATSLRTQTWDSDLKALCELMRSRFGVALKDSRQMMPPVNPLKRTVSPLTNGELDQACAGPLQGWNVEVVHDVAGTGAAREYLSKKFLFQRDKDAFEFLGKLGKVVHQMNHHPVIEAKYADIGIKLCTWDAGHRITHHDLKLGREIEKLARRWRQRSPQG